MHDGKSKQAVSMVVQRLGPVGVMNLYFTLNSNKGNGQPRGHSRESGNQRTNSPGELLQQ